MHDAMANHENACASLGCPAACCRNITLELSEAEANRFLEEQLFSTIDPTQFEISNLDEVASLKQGVYVIDQTETTRASVLVYIRGYCPYLERSTMNCGIYGKRKRPGICSEVTIGHTSCTSQRIRVGLRPVK